MTQPDFTTASELELCRYFIAKFEARPEERWRKGASELHDSELCAVMQCGGYFSGETAALDRVFGVIGAMPELVNDGIGASAKYGKTPRARILAALADIQKKLEAAQ